MKKALIFIVFALFLVSFIVADNQTPGSNASVVNGSGITTNATNNDSIITPTTSCGDYKYSTCPDSCLKRCVPSERGAQYQTADCEGEGSCYAPSGRACPAWSWMPPSDDWCEDGKIIRGTKDENGCPLPPKCITEEDVNRIINMNRNRLRVQEEGSATLPENCVRTGSTLKCDVEEGRIMTVTAGKSGNIIVQVKGVNMSTNVTLYKSNETLYGVFKGNVTKPINYLPDHVRDRIREKLQAHLENETIELDENDGLYKFRAQKKAKLFGLFRVRERVRVEMDPETGEMVRTQNSWWGFLAKDEPGLVGATCGTVSPTGRDECCTNKGFDYWDNQTNECM